VPFPNSESFAGAVQFFVCRAIGIQEVVVGGLGIPEVDREVVARAGGILQELSPLKMGIVLEESDPGSFGPIDSLKAFFTSWLDFELPEDYNHRCPIFCSR